MIGEKTEYIVYEGQEFVIEWYYDAKGERQALEYFEELDDDQKKQLLKLVKLIGDIGEIRNKEKFRSEGDKIFAFKPKPDRFLCFFTEGGKIIITSAFVKKQDKLPQNEKDRALRFKADYQERVKKGSYYHEEK